MRLPAGGFPAGLDARAPWAVFRLLAREDLRHLLEHKRTYCPQALTARQRAILSTPALHAGLCRATAKRLYRLIARGLFGYWDNKGLGRIRP